MRNAILRVAVALALLAAAFGVAPDLWRGQLYWWGTDYDRLSPEHIDTSDPELVLGAILCTQVTSTREPPAEWVAVLAEDEGLTETLRILRCFELPNAGFGANAVSADLDALERMLDAGYGKHARTLDRAVLRYHESRGWSRGEALGLTVEAWSQRSRRHRAGAFLMYSTPDTAVRINELHGRWTAAVAGQLRWFSTTNIYSYRSTNRLLILNAWTGTALLSVMVFLWLWLLLAWALLRRRSCAIGSPRPRTWRGNVPLLVLPLVVWPLGFVNGDDDFVFTAMLGLALGVVLQARARGATARTEAPHTRRLHAAVVVMAIGLAAAVGGVWATALGAHGQRHGDFTLAGGTCGALVCGAGMLVTLHLWARPIETVKSRLPWTMACFALVTCVVASALGLSSEARATRLMSSPLGGVIWTALLGVCYWLARQLATRSPAHFDPRRLVAHWLIVPIIVVLAVSVVMVPSRFITFYWAALILVGLLLLIVLADGSLASSATRAGEVDEAFATRTAAWTAALADGILLASVSALVFSAWARPAIAGQIEDMEQLLGLR